MGNWGLGRDEEATDAKGGKGKNILEWRSKQQASKGTLLARSWVLGADMYRR